VLDRQQRVQVWNQRAEDLWGLRAEEAVDNHFLGLDFGLPVERLAAPLRAVLTGKRGRTQLDVEAVDRRGRSIEVTTTLLPLPLSASDGEVAGAILLMEDAAPPRRRAAQS
jgi:two-component system CheB/CheR fusion protein